MPYKKNTQFFGIPIPCKKDKILESEEIKRMNIIENQLIAGTKGIKCLVFEEGLYKVLDNNDGTCSVVLSNSSTAYSFCGLIGGGYAEAKEPLIWKNLNKGGFHYLYINFSSDLYENVNAFRLLISDSARPDFNGNFLLMATIDLKNDQTKLDTKPHGKCYSNDMVLHTTTNKNPHGKELIQDNLIIKKKLSVELKDVSTDSAIVIDDQRKGNCTTIESKNELNLKDKRITCALSDNDNAGLLTENKTLIGAINEVFKNKIYFVDMESGGKGGVLVTVPNSVEVISAEVQQIAEVPLNTGIYEIPNLGAIAIGYFGYDENVKNKMSFKVYNSGNVGIKIRVRVFYK